MHNISLHEVGSLIDWELESAQKNHGDFSSKFEGYGVIRAEIEELTDEIDDIKKSFDKIWDSIKCHYNAPGAVFSLYLSAINAVREAIQIGAMIKKYAIKFSPEVIPDMERVSKER